MLLFILIFNKQLSEGVKSNNSLPLQISGAVLTHTYFRGDPVYVLTIYFLFSYL